MRLIILCVFALILCGLCWSEEYQIENENGKHRTKLTDYLNYDVLFLIFINLELSDLITLSKMSQPIALSAASAFHHTYKSYTVNLVRPEFDIRYSPSPIVLQPHKKVVSFFGIDTFVAFLEQFGHVIFGIKINENLDRTQCVDMSRLINTHCSESLIHLDFDGIHFSTFEYFTQPFNKLESLALSVGSRSFDASILPMNQLFPKLRKLDFHFCENISYSFIDYKFAHLEHLSLLDFSNTYKPQSGVEELIKKNPHIRSIKLNGYPGSYVQVIKQVLPHIESLDLQYMDVGNETFELDHLKHLQIHDIRPVCDEKLSFPRLKSLILPNPSRNFEGWIHFCRNHNHLSRLHIAEIVGYISEDLDKLTEELPNLIEMTIHGDTVINLRTISRLIESHQSLMKMNIISRFFGQDVTMDILQEQYGNDWTIEGIASEWTFSYSKITFERRSSVE